MGHIFVIIFFNILHCCWHILEIMLWNMRKIINETELIHSILCIKMVGKNRDSYAILYNQPLSLEDTSKQNLYIIGAFFYQLNVTYSVLSKYWCKLIQSGKIVDFMILYWVSPHQIYCLSDVWCLWLLVSTVLASMVYWHILFAMQTSVGSI